MTRTITITFERMPGVNVGTLYPITFQFTEYPMIAAPRKGKKGKYKTIITVCTVTGRGHFFGMGGALKREDDKSNLEMAMRKSSWRTIYSTPDKSIRPIYRAFRRWMWLAKLEHGCDGCGLYDPLKGCEQQCYHAKDYRDDTPKSIIAREFGRVTVRVT